MSIWYPSIHCAYSKEKGSQILVNIKGIWDTKEESNIENSIKNKKVSLDHSIMYFIYEELFILNLSQPKKKKFNLKCEN